MFRIIKYFPLLRRFWQTSHFSSRYEFLGKTKIFLECHEALLKLPEIYQPVNIPGLDYLKPRRPCVDRLAFIMNDLEGGKGFINDIGCQTGFFAFALAETGHIVTAYDMDSCNIAICYLLNELVPVSSRSEFINIKLDLETVENLKQADYTLCLAVFHHIIYSQGLADAKKIISVLRRKTTKKIYFEMGQSNEPVEPWRRSLPDMGVDPFIWIANFLKEGGFKNIRKLGAFPTHVSSVSRYLIVAE